MRTLTRTLLAELLGTVLAATATLTAVLLVGQTIQFVRRFQDFGFEFVAWNFPFLVPIALMVALPLGALAASTLVSTRLSLAHEYTAIRSGGLRVDRALAPALAAGALVMLLAGANTALLVPRCQARQRGLKERGVQFTLERLPAGARTLSLPTRDPIRLSYARYEDGVLHDVSFAQSSGAADGPEGPRLLRHLYARRARLAYDQAAGLLRLSPEDGTALVRDDRRAVPIAISFRGAGLGAWTVDLRDDRAAPLRRYDELSDRALLQELGGAHTAGMPLASPTRLWGELARRWSLAAAALLLALWGALVPLALGARPRVLCYAAGLLPGALTLFLGLLIAEGAGKDGPLWTVGLYALGPALLAAGDLWLWRRLRRR